MTQSIILPGSHQKGCELYLPEEAINALKMAKQPEASQSQPRLEKKLGELAGTLQTQQRVSKTARAASALKVGAAVASLQLDPERLSNRITQLFLQSGVVYGGSALLSGVNAITPHLAG